MPSSRSRRHNDLRDCWAGRESSSSSSSLLLSLVATNNPTTTVNGSRSRSRSRSSNQSANLISSSARELINFAISSQVDAVDIPPPPTSRPTSRWSPPLINAVASANNNNSSKWLLFIAFICLSGGLSVGQLAGAKLDHLEHRANHNNLQLHQLAADDETPNNHLDLYLNDRELLMAAAASSSSSGPSLDLLPGLMSTGQQQRQPTSQPGHYEFDVAPKMEPPTVRKPPYRQTSQQCAGSDLLGGFSPRDTLCGDLNQGRVPLNPLGQSVADQSYPFELIKNKTLQFLARALPVLKLEYETIPKVARYLPANQLLNPTSGQSPLGHHHFDELNQRIVATSSPASSPDAFQAPSFVRRRRRKRSVTGAAGGGGGAGQRQTGSFTVVEMTPNVSLVVSSAHSSPGKIQSQRRDVITREGHRQVAAPSRAPAQVHEGFVVSSAASSPSSAPLLEGRHHDHQDDGSRPQPNNGAQPQNSHAGPGKAGQQTTGSNHASSNVVSVGPGSRASGHSVDVSSDTKSPTSSSSYSSSTAGAHNGQVQARSSSSNGHSAHEPALLQSSKQVDNLSSSSSERRKLDCNQLGNPIVSTVCQTAAHLIDGSKEPAWAQAVRVLGSLYSAPTSSSSSPSSPSSTAADIMLGLLTSSANQQTDAKSSAGAKSASNLWSYLSPLVSSFLSPAGGAGGGGSPAGDSTALSGREQPSSEPPRASSTSAPASKKHDKKQAATPSTGASSFGQLSVSTLASMALAGWATTALAGLVQYFAPSAFAAGPASRTFARRKKPFDPMETFVDTPASLATLSALQSQSQPQQQQQPKQSPLSGSLTGKQPATPCPSMEEYISPTFARNYQGAWKYVVQIPHEGYFTQTIQRSSCVRSKCEFTEGVCHEAPRWVSLLVAEIYYPNAVFGGPGSSGPEPGPASRAGPAGATSSLLAASPSTSHLQQVALGHQPTQSSSSSLRTIHAQDPLQMTDSLNTYNHNLNSALYSAANQLGLDPTNMNQMQQLAEAHNYQLLQRNGLLDTHQHQHQQQQQQQQQQPMQVAESRAGQATALAIAPPSQAQLEAKQQQQQQQLVAPSSAQSDINNYEYIKALALETLRQNPHLSVNDIIKSLQMQTSAAGARRKRDLAGQHHIQPNSNWNHNANIHRSSLESIQSLNELAAYPNSQQANAAKHNDQVGSSSAQNQANLQPEATVPTVGQAVHSTGDSQLAATNLSNPPTSGQQQQQSVSNNQVECDGHDKIGCYVVRVYYDWFLVNGSCKCWRTNSSNSNANNQQATGGQQSASANSFLRRIFTG